MKKQATVIVTALVMLLMVFRSGAYADLQEVKQSGVLRHLGIPYANFVTGAGDGMDVELMQLFAASLGVKYEYVKTDWGTVVEDLIGTKVKPAGQDVELLEPAPVKGDIIANGFTILPWRKKVVDFSTPTFPSQIWLIARADASVLPIKPSGILANDIAAVKALLKSRKVLALKKTCLDPDLYNLSATGANIILFNGKLNELAPAIINGEAEMTILDVPDALVALDKWPSKIKIIGPVSEQQEMALGFPKNSPKLREAFNAFLQQCKQDGRYAAIVKKYYPSAFGYFPDFFK